MDCCKTDSLYHIFGEIVKLHFTRSHNLLEELGVYPGQPPLLFTLFHKDGQSQKELADKLMIKPATITVMLGRMEKAGHVTRKQDAEDQRISRVYLTDKGRETCKHLKKIMNTLSEDCFKNFTEEEMIILRRLLMQVRDNLLNAGEIKLDN